MTSPRGGKDACVIVSVQYAKFFCDPLPAALEIPILTVRCGELSTAKYAMTALVNNCYVHEDLHHFNFKKTFPAQDASKVEFSVLVRNMISADKSFAKFIGAGSVTLERGKYGFSGSVDLIGEFGDLEGTLMVNVEPADEGTADAEGDDIPDSPAVPQIFLRYTHPQGRDFSTLSTNAMALNKLLTSDDINIASAVETEAEAITAAHPTTGCSDEVEAEPQTALRTVVEEKAEELRSLPPGREDRDTGEEDEEKESAQGEKDETEKQKDEQDAKEDERQKRLEECRKSRSQHKEAMKLKKSLIAGDVTFTPLAGFKGRKMTLKTQEPKKVEIDTLSTASNSEREGGGDLKPIENHDEKLKQELENGSPDGVGEDGDNEKEHTEEMEKNEKGEQMVASKNEAHGTGHDEQHKENGVAEDTMDCMAEDTMDNSLDPASEPTKGMSPTTRAKSGCLSRSVTVQISSQGVHPESRKYVERENPSDYLGDGEMEQFEDYRGRSGSLIFAEKETGLPNLNLAPENAFEPVKRDKSKFGKLCDALQINRNKCIQTN